VEADALRRDLKRALDERGELGAIKAMLSNATAPSSNARERARARAA